jgi:DNA-binding CsgD family transcriptional regulator
MKKNNPCTVNLTPCEEKIVGFISLGFCSKEIAGFLNISKYTVDVHRKNILHKFEVKNFAEFVAKYSAQIR